MRTAVTWACFGLGSIGFVFGVLLTQAPGKDHILDLTFLFSAAILLLLSCWLLWRIGSSFLRNTALTIAIFEVLTAVYGLASILTYQH
jgi:hypothetical protein